MSRGHLLYHYPCIDCGCILSDINFRGGILPKRCRDCYIIFRRKQVNMTERIRSEDYKAKKRAYMRTYKKKLGDKVYEM